MYFAPPNFKTLLRAWFHDNLTCETASSGGDGDEILLICQRTRAH